MKNILIAISGPSGVGKGTLVERILAHNEDVALSVSCTTRQPRAGEVNGKDYFFITKEEFLKKIKENDFLEYDEHFGNFYGTPKSFVEATLKEKSVLLEIDVKGALNAKRLIPEAVLVMVVPPSLEELRKRLSGRGTETEEEIRRRVARMEYELSFRNEYDYVVVNDDLDAAEKRIADIIRSEKEEI